MSESGFSGFNDWQDDGVGGIRKIGVIVILPFYKPRLVV